jgi:carboxyl-terminal processing protease
MKKIIIIIIIIFGYTQAYSQSTENLKKIETVLNYIDLFYVDEIDQNELTEKAIVNLLKELDPHSVYISKEEVDEMNEPLVGNFEGVGIQFNILDDTIIVVSTIPGGPSEKVGVQAGDRIVQIDGVLVAGNGITNKGVFDKLRGPKDTEVVIEIKRDGYKKLLDFKIVRDKIPIFSIDASYMVNEYIGYIKINRFAAKTPEEFTEAILKLKALGMKNLIIDLAGNSGGYLNAAFKMADELLSDNKMIVYTEGVNSPRNEMKSTIYGNFEDGNVVVLIDQYSASASEILSGAIQDWDRGLVIGRRSYGKGLVQRQMPLPDGSQIRLTIANYYTPSGRFIQKPYDEGEDAYRNDLSDRYESGELTDSVIAVFPDSLKYKTANGRIVYGGGGITPDIYVPLDTTFSTEFYSQIFRKGLVNKYSLNYANKHRKELLAYYPDVQIFDKNFETDEDFLAEFLTYCEAEKIVIEQAQVEKSKHVINTQIKALIARNIYDNEAYYYIFNKNLNDSFQKAVEAIEQNWFTKYKVSWIEK